MRFWMARYAASRVGDGRADLVADVDGHLFCVRGRATEKNRHGRAARCHPNKVRVGGTLHQTGLELFALVITN